MISTINVKCNAAKPNFPLQPMFAFQGSPSSIRILDVPKSIGNWAITSVKVVVTYPDNIMVEKNAVRNGSVWVATVEGCNVAGKVANGYEVLADGKDEDGNDVTGYVLGKGDVYIIENDTDISRLLDKIAVRYVEDIPDVPTKGDLMNSNGELRLFDGNNWILISTGEHSVVHDSQITIQKNGTSVGSFTVNASEPKSIDIPVPSRTSDLTNDVGYITANALPTKVSELQNDVGFITASAIPSNVGAFTNDAGYLTAASTTIQNLNSKDLNHETRIREVEKQATGARDWMDLSYPTVNANAQDGFGIAGFTVDFPSYGNQPSTSNYMSFYSVVSGTAIWKTASGNLEMKTSDGTHFSYYNNNGWMDFPLNNTSPTEAWTHYFAQGIRPAYITASFKTSTMKKIALEDYVDAQIASSVPSNVSELNNDAGYLTSSSNAFTEKRDKTDMDVKGIPRDVGNSHFNVTDGTTTNNAWWYGEGRWLSGETFDVIATSTPDQFELQKNETTVGTFTLDNDFKASIVEGGITYSIVGYKGSLVVSDELDRTLYGTGSKMATKDWVDANLNVSGIGCSTVTMSGIYSDLTSFSYNVVVQ